MKNLTTIVHITMFSSVSQLYADKPNKVETRTNILFIAINYMNVWINAFDKNNPIQIPKLESLEKYESHLTKACYTTATYNPSSTVILTGLGPTTKSIYNNKPFLEERLPNVVITTQFFAQNR